MFTVNQVLAAPVIVSKQHLEVAEPQAIVINSGVANAATGERGRARRARDGRRGGAAARPLLRGGARSSRPASSAPCSRSRRCSRACARPPADLAASGGADAAERDPDHRHADEGVGGLARRLHRRRDGEGVGDDPPAARDDAGGRHDRLSARGRARRSSSCARRSTAASTRSPSTASARRTTPSACSRTARAGSSGRPRPTPPSRSRSAASATSSRSRSSPTARVRPCSPRSR